VRANTSRRAPLIAAMVDVIGTAPNPDDLRSRALRHGRISCSPRMIYLSKHHALDRAQKKKLKAGSTLPASSWWTASRAVCHEPLLHGIGGNPRMNMPVVTKGRAGPGSMANTRSSWPIRRSAKRAASPSSDAGESSKKSLIIQGRTISGPARATKQLNFLQHIFTILKQHGRRGVVLPDNGYSEAGAGETIRANCSSQADVHTLLAPAHRHLLR